MIAFNISFSVVVNSVVDHEPLVQVDVLTSAGKLVDSVLVELGLSPAVV